MNKLFLLFTIVTLFNIQQKDFKIDIKTKEVASSLVYSIESNQKSDFQLKVINEYADSEVAKEITHKNVIGKKYFKMDLSSLPKGEYNILITNINSKSFIQKKIHKK
ncbi:hypothetical protein [Pseudotenacibaculum haliotis]|uniref:Secretion system C-terminal sorting domain-containing protein n=1 Tax=Pseudotenacibaculum haliotis TaxID=1862138 RepID=A0ABW5LV48_9FLAO